MGSGQTVSNAGQRTAERSCIMEAVDDLEESFHADRAELDCSRPRNEREGAEPAG